MRHSIIVRSLLPALSLSLLVAVAGPGCSTPFNCPPGYTVWVCEFSIGKPNTCGTISTAKQQFTCATERIAAAQQVENYFANDVLYGMTCTSTGFQRYPPQAAHIKVQDLPSCLVTTDDDPCVSCAKTSCCADYQACFADANCTCLVACLSHGGTVAACTASDGCGSPSAVSISATACLDTDCPAQCVNPGGMCPPMTSGSGSSSSSTGGPTCTPGPTGSGQACLSDGDCASCVCNPQTMTCN